MNNIINSSGVYDINAYNLTSNKATILSTFNVSGLTILNTTSINSSLNVSGLTILNNNTSINSSLNVSGSTILNNNTSINSSLNVSGLTQLNSTSITSSLNVSGLTILNNNTSINSSLNVSGITILNNNTSINSSLNVSGSTILNNNTSINSSLNVSGTTILNNNTSINSSLNVSGTTILNNNTTILSSLNVSGTTTLNNNTSVNSSLNVSGNTLLNNNTTINSSLYINTTTIDVNKAALSVDSSSAGILVNIKQNYGWIDNLNYALNVDGYSNFGGVQINGQNTNNIYKRMGDLTLGVGEINSIILKTNSGAWETMKINPYGVSINTSLYITGFTTFNNNVTCTSSLNVSGTATINNLLTSSSLNVSGTSNIGPLYINNYTGLLNTFFQIGTTGNILNVCGNYSRYGCSEDPSDTHITLYKGAGAAYIANYNTSGNTLHLFGDTNATSNTYLTLQPNLNTSYNPFIIQGNTTMNSNLNILGNVYAANLPNVSTFYIIITKAVTVNSNHFYKYDIDLRLYTTSVSAAPYISQRKFKITCSLTSGALDAGSFNLNYDVDYNLLNYPSTGPQASLSQFNGVNVNAFGFPYSNTKFNKIMSNDLFLLKKDFNYITVFSRFQANILCIIIDYLT